MTKYAVIENNVVKNLIVGEDNLDIPNSVKVPSYVPCGIDWVLSEDGNFSEPARGPKVWTPLEFLNNFTQEQIIMVTSLTSGGNIAAAMAMLHLTTASEVVSTDPRTEQALDLFIELGVITQEDKDRILGG